MLKFFAALNQRLKGYAHATKYNPLNVLHNYFDGPNKIIFRFVSN